MTAIICCVPLHPMQTERISQQEPPSHPASCLAKQTEKETKGDRDTDAETLRQSPTVQQAKANCGSAGV